MRSKYQILYPFTKPPELLKGKVIVNSRGVIPHIFPGSIYRGWLLLFAFVNDMVPLQNIFNF